MKNLFRIILESYIYMLWTEGIIQVKNDDGIIRIMKMTRNKMMEINF